MSCVGIVVVGCTDITHLSNTSNYNLKWVHFIVCKLYLIKVDLNVLKCIILGEKMILFCKLNAKNIV